MRWRRERRRAPLSLTLLGLAIGLVVVLAAPTWSGADPAQQVTALRASQDGLSARSHTALLSLYALDSQLAQARSRISALQNEAATLRAEQAQTQREETIARDAWRKSGAALGDQLRALYEQGEPDAISIVLGSSSVDDAMTRLDALERTARVDRQTVTQARTAERTLETLRNELALRAQRVQTLVLQTQHEAATLEQARAQRIAYVASLAHQRAMNARRISRLELAASRITARSQAIAPAAAASPTPVSSASATDIASGERLLTVTATGYSLAGHTATGMPVGWGVVAVDPSFIPLGTRISIPGYGDGVAADTGSAIRGATIDLWFPTLAQAMAWGRRTITVTLH